MKKEIKILKSNVENICVDLNHEGLGVVKLDNIPYFVPNILVNEKGKFELTRKENAKFGNGSVISRLNDSSLRCNPICNKFLVCGGCDLMHMNYEAQLQFKKKMVNETFKRIGHLDYEFKDIIGAKNFYSYRNKVIIPFSKNSKGKAIFGFYKKQTHDIIEFSKCYLQDDIFTEFALLTKNLLNELNIDVYDEVNHTGVFKSLMIRKTYDNKYMLVFIVFNYNNKIKTSFEYITNVFTRKYNNIESIIVNINSSTNNTILGNDYNVLYGKDYLIEDILDVKFKMSHKSFFQINHEQTLELYKKAIEFCDLTKDDILIDCYCGVGTMGLIASKYCKSVYGIEVINEAIDNANNNALLNNINNCKFYCGKAEEEINNIKDATKLIVDPPRKGLDIKLVNTLLLSNIKRIVYVACDCATMARDISLLSSKYTIEKGILVDLFPQTAHIESITLLVRKDASIKFSKVII